MRVLLSIFIFGVIFCTSCSGDLGREKALRFAAVHNDINKVQKLIEAGTNIDAQTEKGHTALMVASQMGHSEMVAYLIKSGANLNLKDERGLTALHTASSAGRIQSTKTLVGAGANVLTVGQNGSTPLMDAARKNKETVRILLAAGANVNYRTKKSNWSVLHNACRHGDLGIVMIIVEAGAVIDVKSTDGKSPLGVASTDDIRNFLLKKSSRNQYNNPSNSDDTKEPPRKVQKLIQREIRP